MSDTTTALIEEYGGVLKWGGVGLVGAHFLGYDVMPSLPPTTELWALAGIVAAGIAWFASDVIDGLLPDPDRVYLEVVNAQNTEAIEEWELGADTFEDLEVVNGPLNHLSENIEECYECVAYDPDRNLAVGTWRKSRPESAFVGHTTVDDALSAVAELREHYEPLARKGDYIIQNIPGLLRALDSVRLEHQTRMLEEDLAPTFGDMTTYDVLEEELPETITPDRIDQSDAEDLLAADGVDDLDDDFGDEFEIVDYDDEARSVTVAANGSGGGEDGE